MMRHRIHAAFAAIAVCCAAFLSAAGQPGRILPVQYEELTAPDFIRAVEQSDRTCLIPMGILEKHGAHLPLGTDLLDVRNLALQAAKSEYVIVFPQYYFGQIFEAKHQPGTIAYSADLIYRILQETCDELARNGIRKIILVNGHGGNNSFLPYFCQTQLAGRREYAVYVFSPDPDPEQDEAVRRLKKTQLDGHAGEVETSTMMTHRPDIVHPDRAGEQDGSDQNRLQGLKDAYTAIWWYAKFPNHYAGDGSAGTRALGEALIRAQKDRLVEMIRSVKQDDQVLRLQKRFYRESEDPLDTKQ
ncbi:creatininase family protein [bacterium]|nr:creatininase family protein [bacterium]